MIIHNTTYSVLPEAEESWIKWVRAEHIPRLAALPGVKNYRFLKLLTEIESDGVTYTIQADIDSLPAGEDFLANQDPELQAHMMDSFRGQVLYFQTLLKTM